MSRLLQDKTARSGIKNSDTQCRSLPTQFYFLSPFDYHNHFIQYILSKVKIPYYYRTLRLLRENRGIALLFFVNLGALDGGEWSTRSPSRLYPGKDPVPIVQETGSIYSDNFKMRVTLSYFITPVGTFILSNCPPPSNFRTNCQTSQNFM